MTVDIAKMPMLTVSVPERQEHYLSPEWSLVWVTLVLVVVTGVLAAFTYSLYRATVDLAKDAKATGDKQSALTNVALATASKSADAAMQSAGAAKQSADALMLSERAYVTAAVEAPGVKWGNGGNFEISIALKNHGRTPANVTDVAIGYRVLDSDSTLEDVSISASEVVPKVFLMPTDTFGHARHFQLHEPTLGEVQGYERTLWVFGHIDYVDTFGARHRSGFARVYNRHLDDGKKQNLVRRVEGDVQYDYDRPTRFGEGDWP